MAVPRKASSSDAPRRPPARTPQAREHQLTAAALDLVEKQIREGTASSQILTHFLKLATEREKLEREQIQKKNNLLDAQAESHASGKRIEDLYTNAIAAMRAYSGSDPDEEPM
jgi:hypothetical protein